MYTSMDKAIVAIVMGIISLISMWLGWGSVQEAASTALDHVASGVTPQDVTDVIKPALQQVQGIVPPAIGSVISVLTPLLVWLVPNRTK